MNNTKYPRRGTSNYLVIFLSWILFLSGTVLVWAGSTAGKTSELPAWLNQECQVRGAMLSENWCLLIQDTNLEIIDASKPYLECFTLNEGTSYARPAAATPEGGVAYAFQLALIKPGCHHPTETDSSEYLVSNIKIIKRECRDQETLLSAVAGYPDGCEETWQILCDAKNQRFRWSRESTSQRQGNYVIKVQTVRDESWLQLWQTGRGRQIVSKTNPGVLEGVYENLAGGDFKYVQEDVTTEMRELAAEAENEAIFYSPHRQNCFRLGFSQRGLLHIAKSELVRDPVFGEPSWELDNQGKKHVQEWELTWTSHTNLTESVDLDCSWGPIAVARDFAGFKKLNPVDAGNDFGAFFAQVYLGCLPLNLRDYDGKICPRANVLMGGIECYKFTWSRDNTWAYEFLYLVDPAGVAQLLEDYINLRQVREGVGGREDALAELLMLGGRHYYLTGDVNFAKAHIEQYHAAAHRLLSTIPAGQALPVCTLSWDGQGIVMGKEPYFTAECYAGLNRLADMEEALGDADSSIQWRNAAAAMKHAALTDYREGGLWHSDRGTFINFIDYKDPQISTPQGQNWSPGKMMPPGIPRREFALYETIVPIWLGLLDDEQKVHQVYEWIDSHYSYASGRGELTFPPFIIQNFVALLDVAVRQKYHVPADNLLQLLTDHALDAGIPVAERAYGSYGHGTAYQAHVGRIWDNAPFFAIVLNQHYGLDYSYQGWLIREPRPLANYSLTRLENVRHKNAVYSLSWQGTGTVESILVDGKTWPARLLNLTEGSHTVLIKLHE